MSEDALNRAIRINGLAECQKEVSGTFSNNPLRVVELRGLPHSSLQEELADKLAIAFTAAQRGIERLERARIINQVSDAKHDRVYYATALLVILEDRPSSSLRSKIRSGLSNQNDASQDSG